MPLDPTIPLGITPQASAAANPLEMMGKFATIQNALNQNKLFQQTFAARQLAGNIMSSAPNMEDGLQQIMKSPAAPFMGEFITQLRQSQLSQTQMEGERQKQGMDALTYAQKLALPSSMANPASLDSGYLQGLRLAAPGVQQKVLGAINDQRSALLNGLPEDTSKWTQADFSRYTQRAAAAAMAVGTPVDVIHGIVGQPKTIETGYGIQGGVQLPATSGSGIVPSGNVIPQGLAPARVGLPGGATVEVPGVPGGQRQGAGNPLSPTGGPAPSGNALGVAPTSPPISGLGTPIVAPSPPPSRTAIGGLPIMNEQQVKLSNDLAEEYGKEGKKAFEAAGTAQASLSYISHAYDEMAKGSLESGQGGFLIPGAFAEQRQGIAKAINTIAQMTGGAPPFDSTKVAATEDLMKESLRLGLSVGNQFLGQQKEAATTIERIGRSVPGIDNTYMGGKLIVSSLEAAAQRVIDQRNFDNDWKNKHNDDLRGADVEFNRQFPAKAYAEKVLTQFGLTPKGEWTTQAVQNAVKNGYLNWDQAADILKKSKLVESK